jgi:hypothetical protein
MGLRIYKVGKVGGVLCCVLLCFVVFCCVVYTLWSRLHVLLFYYTVLSCLVLTVLYCVV